MEDTSARQLLNIKLKAVLQTWTVRPDAKNIEVNMRYSRLGIHCS